MTLLTQLTLPQIIILAASGACFVILIVCLCLSISNTKKLKRIMKNSANGNLAEAIEEYYGRLEDTAKEIKNASDRLKKIEIDCANAITQVSIVNFDAYENITGKCSFCIAALNQHNDGFLLTSLYGRDNCVAYLKNVSDGKALVRLMDEEKETLQKALYTGEKSGD